MTSRAEDERSRERIDQYWKSVEQGLSRYSSRSLVVRLGFRFREGHYVVRATFIIPTAAIVVWALVPESWWLVRWPLALFGAYFVADTLLVNTSIAFVTQRAIHGLRSVVLSILTFVNLASVFAFFYVLQRGCFADGKGGGRSLTPIEAEYFSLVTIMTLGYGDIAPGGDCGWLARLTVMAELAVGLYFLAVILSIVTQWVKEV